MFQADMHSVPFEKTRVTFDNIQIHEATLLPPDSKVKLYVSIHPGTGNFEVTNDSGTVVASGTITTSAEKIMEETLTPPSNVLENPDLKQDVPKLPLTAEDVYKELSLKGYEYGPAFQLITSANNEGL